MKSILAMLFLILSNVTFSQTHPTDDMTVGNFVAGTTIFKTEVDINFPANELTFFIQNGKLIKHIDEEGDPTQPFCVYEIPGANAPTSLFVLKSGSKLTINDSSNDILLTSTSDGFYLGFFCFEMDENQYLVPMTIGEFKKTTKGILSVEYAKNNN